MVGRTFAAVGQMQGGGRCDGGSVRSAPETPVTLRNELRSPAESVGDVRALRKETQAGGKGRLRAAASQLGAEAGLWTSERTGDGAERRECVSLRACLCQ